MHNIFITLFMFCTFYTSAQIVTLDSIFIQMKMDDKKNILHVTESYHLDSEIIMPEWKRVIYHKGIPWQDFLYQRIINVKLKDEGGSEFQPEHYGYGRERSCLDYSGKNLKGSCYLSYDILNPFDGSAYFDHEFYFDYFPLAATYITIDFELPSKIKFEENSWDISYYDQNIDGEFEYADGINMIEIRPSFYHLELKTADGFTSFAEVSLEGSFQFTKEITLESPTTFAEEWEEQGGSLLWIALAALLIAVVLRFMPPVIYPAAIRVYYIVILGLMFYTSYPLCSFFWKMTGWSDNFAIEIGSLLVFAGVFILFVFYIEKHLRKLNSNAYFSVMTFPVLLLFLSGTASVNPAMWLLITIGFAPLIFWFQSKNSGYLGANSYQLVEHVETSGKLSFDELSKISGLGNSRLLKIIENIEQHPILIDHEKKEFLSTSTAAFQQKHLICNNCGAATEIFNEDLLKCKHCHTSYRESQSKKSSKPVPELVEVASGIIVNTGRLFYILCILLIIAILAEFIFEGFADFVLSLATVLVFSAIFGGIGFYLQSLSKELKSGKSPRAVWALTPLTIFITPAYIIYKFSTDPRILLHFDINAAKLIDDFLKKQGTVSISELSEHLDINKNEALDLAGYLCGNNLINAIYNRSENNIVHRDIWAKLSGANSCKKCGGFVQIKNKQTECMHCGDTA
jgi:hypothetical protein